MITDKHLKSWVSNPPEKKVEQSIGNGVAVRASTTGVVSFYFRFKENGKDKRITLGNYPVLTLKTAREEGIRLSLVYQQGGAVVDAAKTRYKNYIDKLTVGECVNEYLSKHGQNLRAATHNLYRYTLEKNLKMIWQQPAEIVRYDEWLRVLDNIRTETSANSASQVLKIAKRCFGWCLKRELINGCHALRITTPSIVGVTKSERDRVLSIDEIQKVWRAISMTKLSLPTRNCLKLLILTGARNSEIREATWDEFDLDNGIWVLPAARNKTNEKVRRPLSSESVRLLKELKSAYPVKYVIPSTDSNLLKPITTHAIARAMRRIRAKLNIDQFVPHDFRRTIVTNLAEQGVAPHVTEKMLGHKLMGVMAIYNRHDWLEEQRDAYEKWAEVFSIEN